VARASSPASGLAADRVTRPANEPRPGDERSSGTRERILLATLRLIGEHGIAAVTNRRVAAAARVSLGSLTYHFASQTELLRQALLLHVERETERRRSISEQLRAHDPSAADIAVEVERLVAEATDIPDIPEQVAELELHLQAARDPELRDASRRCFEASEEIAVAALEAIGAAEPGRHAPAVVALMNGLAVRRLAAGGRDASGTAEALMLMARGLAARSA
jgi:DNA-binding transcriptional regulator YbjK